MMELIFPSSCVGVEPLISRPHARAHTPRTTHLQAQRAIPSNIPGPGPGPCHLSMFFLRACTRAARLACSHPPSHKRMEPLGSLLPSHPPHQHPTRPTPRRAGGVQPPGAPGPGPGPRHFCAPARAGHGALWGRKQGVQPLLPCRQPTCPGVRAGGWVGGLRVGWGELTADQR